MNPKNWSFAPGTASTLYLFARYISHAVNKSVHATVQVAVEDSPATAAVASTGSTPGCGVIRKKS